VSNHLKVQTRKIDEKATILELVGDVNSDGDTLIKDAYRKAVSEGANTVAFDMTNTEYINTSGISVLISVVMEAKKASQKVLVFGVSPHYKKVFDLVRFSVYVTMFDDEASARASLTAVPPPSPPTAAVEPSSAATAGTTPASPSQPLP
jgi:anti-anti-sigma factor